MTDQQPQEPKYPQIRDREIPISQMSSGYIHNQLHKIYRTGINWQYEEKLRQELHMKFSRNVKVLDDGRTDRICA